MLFTLRITDISFDKGLPLYPSLIDYHQNGGLLLDPAIRVEEGGASGPFEIVFQLAEDEEAQFLTSPSDPVGPLQRIDDLPMNDLHWSATVENEGRVCRLRWTASQLPETQTLLLICQDGTKQSRKENPLHLVFSFIKSRLDRPREDLQKQPSIPSSLPTLSLSGTDLLYDVFQDEARAQLAPGYFFEPAIRLAQGHEQQFAIQLDASTKMQFVRSLNSDGCHDQVPVRYLWDETGNPALRPTLRQDANTCIVTWQPLAQAEAPLQHICTFNLEIERTSEDQTLATTQPMIGRRRRVDPTVIEDPYLPPPDPPGYPAE